jgi:hypothetical protein
MKANPTFDIRHPRPETASPMTRAGAIRHSSFVIRHFRLPPLAALLALAFSLQPSALVLAAPLGTAFTYQGKLTDGGPSANGLYDFEFTLYDAVTNGTHVGGPLPLSAVGVTNGFFTVTLDFGAGVFLGEERWLGIAVRSNRVGGFATFPVRQWLTPAPYALHASQAGIAASVTGNSVTAQGLSTPAPPAAGQVLTFNGTNLAWASPGGAAVSNAWLLGGNAGTTPGINFLGTTDSLPLEFKVNGQRALRLEPNTNGAPNMIGGAPLNSVALGAVGATIGGGANNTIQIYANDSTIAGGSWNQVASFSEGATVSGGISNLVNGTSSTIGGGNQNVAGLHGTVPGGALNQTTGDFSFAAGRQAKAIRRGSFVWADSTDADFNPYGYGVPGGDHDSFNVRATGGIYLWTAIDPVTHAPTAGAYMEPGDPAWQVLSDRGAKENFQAVEPTTVLDKLTHLPITEWNMKVEAAVKEKDARIAELERRLAALEQLLKAQTK